MCGRTGFGQEGGFWQVHGCDTGMPGFGTSPLPLSRAGMLPVHRPAHLPLLSAPGLGPRDCGRWERGGSSPLAAAIRDGHIHPGAPRLEEAETPFSLLRCSR